MLITGLSKKFLILPSEIASPYRIYCLFTAMKIGIASLICFFLIGYFNLENGYAVLLPILFAPLSTPLRMHQSTWEVALGNALGFLIFSPMLLLTDHFWFYFLISFLGCFFCIYLPLKTKSRFLLTGLFALVTGAILFLMTQTKGPLGSFSFGVELARDACYGALILFLVDFLIFPRFAARQLEIILKQTPIENMPIEDCQKLLQVSRYRIGKNKAHYFEAYIGELHALKFYCQRAAHYFDFLQQKNPVFLKFKLDPKKHFFNLEILFKNFILEIQSAIAQKALIKPEKTLGNENYKYKYKYEYGPAEEALNLFSEQLEGLFIQAKKIEKIEKIECHWDAEIFQLAYALKRHMENALKVLTTERERKIPDPPPMALPISKPFKMAVLASSILCVVSTLVSILVLPGGMQPILAAFAGSMQPNLGKLSRQLLDRFLGALFGTAASVLILFALEQVTHLWVLFFTFMLAVTLFCYLAISRPQWGYIFLQAVITVLMLVAYDTTSLVPTVEVLGQRFFGVIFGFIVSFIVMSVFKLDSAKEIFKEKLNTYLSRSAEYIFKPKGQALSPLDYSALILLLPEMKVLLAQAELEFGYTKADRGKFKNQVFLLERAAYNLETLFSLRLNQHVQAMQDQAACIANDVIGMNLTDWLFAIEKILRQWPDEASKKNLNDLHGRIQNDFKNYFESDILWQITEEDRTYLFALGMNLNSLCDVLKKMY